MPGESPAASAMARTVVSAGPASAMRSRTAAMRSARRVSGSSRVNLRRSAVMAPGTPVNYTIVLFTGLRGPARDFASGLRHAGRAIWRGSDGGRDAEHRPYLGYRGAPQGGVHRPCRPGLRHAGGRL